MTADLTSFNTTVQGAIDTDCGSSSPYGGVTSTTYNGVQKNALTVVCQSVSFPNSGNRAVSNVATYIGGVLTIGTPYATVPGAFSGGTVPSSATLVLN